MTNPSHKLFMNILTFWFGDINSDGTISKEIAARWYRKEKSFDNDIRRQFIGVWESINKSNISNWTVSLVGKLALVIVLDQFSRNMFRNSPRSFEKDSFALELTLCGLEQKMDQQFKQIERQFFYMPLMHSENIEHQKISIQCFERLVAESTGSLQDRFKNTLRYAHLHEEIIQRFGRYPHRNEILGRKSTSEEVAFLKQPHSRF
ncbi:MAG: DUF924 domain-containing protein [Trichodesmium sp. St16_bin4-tuft]|nr:DUF924 domain-containing protein [Trichodesmium sp. St5_bin8]MDE5078827.1 DUF924 domain-containing protein [Trichodesmium sp. St2_bin6]MDE5098979.1 DUF924 domain-containing protein [Trichodesmium sp. St16_bin4-tuft]MDE5104564.1 DUF924 domain-containing protein [Trichodesmium sp. St19_bin2]